MKTDTALSTRKLVAADQDQLWRWLRIALWDPPPAGLRPISVLQQPGTRIYAENWGQTGDVGVVAQLASEDIGACWMRLLPVGIGLASIDAQTPQLGIALESPYQHKGYGHALMSAALQEATKAGYSQVSLTAHPLNPAQRLYKRCGFQSVGTRNGYQLMLASVQ